MFRRKYEIVTVMFISTCPQFHSHWINRLGKRNFPPLLCCFSWVLITKLICFAWSSGVVGRVGARGDSCLVSERMSCQLSCEIHTSKRDNLFHTGQISHLGIENAGFSANAVNRMSFVQKRSLMLKMWYPKYHRAGSEGFPPLHKDCIVAWGWPSTSNNTGKIVSQNLWM